MNSLSTFHHGRISIWQGITPNIAGNAFLAAGSQVIGQVSIGEWSSIWFNTVVRGDVNTIKIGSHTNIQDNTTVHVTQGSGPTSIGDRVTIGHNCIIHACHIEDESLIGMGSILLDGCRIPNHCFVAAGSLITPGKTFSPGSMIMGSPAKEVRKLSEQEIEGIRCSAKDYIATASYYCK